MELSEILEIIAPDLEEVERVIERIRARIEKVTANRFK
jgi:hypothetical protein